MKQIAGRLVVPAILFLVAACRVLPFLPGETPAQGTSPAIVSTTSLTTATFSAPIERPTPTHTLRAEKPSQTAIPTAAIPPLETFVVEIPAPSLAGNLLGDPEEQPARIFLPPSYRISDQRYPVVYFLPGWGGSVEEEHPFPAEKVARLMAEGRIQEMILVIPNGNNALGGSFYVNSPVTGNWEDFIVSEVVGYVDANYRTIPEAGGRGIAGHSMGGFGALNLGMRHPDVFSAVYALSPGFFDPRGLAEAFFSPKNRIKAFLQELGSLEGLSREDALRKMKHFDGPKALALGYGAAFAPNSQGGPPYIDYPYSLKGDELIRDPRIWKRWENGFGDWAEKILEFQANLSELRGIIIDYGTKDEVTWIPPGSRYVAKQLEAAGIPHQLLSFEGDHNSMSEQRALEVMLPFFSEIFGK